MARYSYHGPVQHISIAVGQIKGPEGEMQSEFKDVALIPDAEPVELPSDSPVVVGMLDAKLLQEVDDPAPAKPATRSAKKG
ncbi:hypothetical protein RA27_20550 [Ruegeria sp. ANG-R]|uniref:hypothetical protein n=1 Tax=Ruegeria sp. ANG-R TaxID=1577903 RepID=UPI00058091D7|nr:hypothetical protein [Ruegeria sp. ANG-R]KIC38157.1 hypothetical protein RA27_20550 [Ruegeria sp. ANG-R]